RVKRRVRQRQSLNIGLEEPGFAACGMCRRQQCVTGIDADRSSFACNKLGEATNVKAESAAQIRNPGPALQLKRFNDCGLVMRKSRKRIHEGEAARHLANVA